MSNFVRRIVSGNKARFKDSHLDLELDLVYVTDNVIIMGFPASGVEGLYRNNREDAKKFLEHRHGKNYWVFNFCPLRENSYSADFFDGHVSRYPFPDHHAPPLAILPLFVREAREWLSGSSDRVAVMHCKAGKGRSGTLACSYLLSLDESPSAPKLQRSLTKKEWAKQRAEKIMETVETEEMNEGVTVVEGERIMQEKGEPVTIPDDTDVKLKSILESARELSANSEETIKTDVKTTDGPSMISISDGPTSSTPLSMSPVSTSVVDNTVSAAGTQSSKAKGKAFTLDDVLALHTSRRMKMSSSADQKLKQGVSIPSQRRWLYYWSLILAGDAPRDFWVAPRIAPMHKVRLRQIMVRMRELRGVKMNLLKIANQLMEKTSASKSSTLNRGQGPVWVSLARYNDAFVEMLEKWEKHTRSEDGGMGKKRKGAEYMSDEGQGEALRDVFKDGKWDKGKMVRSFARLGDSEGSAHKDHTEEGQIITYRLKPLSDKKWESVQEQIKNPKFSAEEVKTEDRLSVPTTAAPSTVSSVTDLAQVIYDDEGEDHEGILLDAEREVRAKLYMGQVFMGWFWFVPAFHMPQPPPTSAAQRPPMTHFVLTRKEIDFPIGAGAALVDVDVALDWVIPSAEPAAATRQPPKTQTSEDSARGAGGEPGPGGVIAGLQAAIADASGRETIEAVQASDQ